MYEFYTFLSGGAGNSTAAWEILSASNASSVGGPGTITGTGSITWNSSGAHTWWVCRKNILPVTASTTRYIYLTVDLEDSDDTKAYFSFDYDAPNFSGQSTSTRPAETARAYEKMVNLIGMSTMQVIKHIFMDVLIQLVVFMPLVLKSWHKRSPVSFFHKLHEARISKRTRSRSIPCFASSSIFAR